MRKLVSVLMAFAFALSLVSVAAAEEKKAEPMKAAEPAKAAPAPAKKAVAKKAPKAHQLTGTVEAVDAAAGTLTVKGKKDTVDLKAGKKVNLDKIAVGDKVLVSYSGDTASSVKKVPAKKAAKKIAKKTAKKTAKKAAAAAPAATAVPAEPAKPAAPAAPAEKK